MKDEHLIKRICNPLEFGFWRLKIELDFKKNPLNKLIEEKEDLSIQELFSFLILNILEKNSENTKKEFLDNDVSDLIKNQYSHPLRDINKYKKKISQIEIDKYLKDLEYLKSFILVATDKFDYEFSFYSTKEGKSFKLSLPSKYSDKLEANSYYKEPLEAIKNLIILLNGDLNLYSGGNTEIKITKEYFTEEEVFENYFYLLAEIDFSEVSENFEVIENIERAKEEFFLEKFDSVSSFCGIALETLLSEIYTTLIRDSPPRDGVGHLLKELMDKINNICQKKDKEEDRIISETFKDCSKSTEECLNLFCKKIEKILDRKLSELNKESYRFFPESLLKSIKKAILNRNKVSHSSSEEVETFEASLSLRGIIYLLIWWGYIKKRIKDWDADKRTIIDFIKKESDNFLKKTS
jgi:hypothetical protein